jgi:hypothetical protein
MARILGCAILIRKEKHPMEKSLLPCLLALFSFSMTATSQQIVSLDKSEVRRGDKLAITLAAPLQSPPVIRLVRRECFEGQTDVTCSVSLQSQLAESPVPNPQPPPPQTPPSTGTNKLSLAISPFVPLGNYVACFTSQGSGSQSDMCTTEPKDWNPKDKHVENPAANLKILPAAGSQLAIKEVFPEVGYSEKNKTYAFTVRGSGFSVVPEDNHLVLDRVGNVHIRWKSRVDESNCENPPREAYGAVVNPAEVTFWCIAKPAVNGPRTLQILVGDEKSDVVSPAFLLSPVNKTTPLLIAVIAVVALAGIGYFIVKASKGGQALTTEIDGKKYGILSAFLLDKETDTYSLSKLQFYLWTGAAVFGYVYLLVCRSLVQGKFEFVDVPENLPGIIGISAFTGVAAIGITAAKGSKGAGETRPSIADFLTNGGVVSAERFQFLTWTLLGVAVLVFLTVSFDPGLIKDLPSVPERFLYLMGLSSLGYLGGKLARKPGPIIDKIIATRGSLKLEIHGSYLSEDAHFWISDDAQRTNEVEITPDPRDKEGKDRRPQVVAKDTKADTAGIASVLLLTISEPKDKVDKWLSGKHYLKLVNPDGQKAVWWFEVGASGTNSDEPKPEPKPEPKQTDPSANATTDESAQPSQEQLVKEATILGRNMPVEELPKKVSFVQPKSSAPSNDEPEISARDV